MTLTLTLRTEPPARVLGAPLAPERLCGLNRSAVAGVDLRCGAETVALGDLFEVSGARTEENHLVLAGDLRRFDGRAPRCPEACCGSSGMPGPGSGPRTQAREWG